MKCANCGHPDLEHHGGECDHKYTDDPRDSSHICDCRNYMPSGEAPGWKKKIVTMVIEIQTPVDSEDLAKAVTRHVTSGVFKAALSGSLLAMIGEDFDVVDISSVEVEEENSG